MIAPEAGLSISRQCTLLWIARSSFYYRPRPESAEEPELLKRLDRISRLSSLRQPPAPGGAVARGDFDGPPARPAADEKARAVGGQNRSGIPASGIPGTRSTHTSCAARQSTGRTKCGLLT